MSATRLQRAVGVLTMVLAAVPAYAQPAAPSIQGATVWTGTSGSLQVGAAIPLGAWPSLFRRGGQGELVALIGVDGAGLGIGHKFENVRLNVGTISAGAAIGLGAIIPYSQACPPGKTCRTGLRSASAVVFVTLPLSGSGK